MSTYQVSVRIHSYFSNGFTSENFGDGKRISTLTGCDLYVYKQKLEVRTAIEKKFTAASSDRPQVS